VWNFEFELPIGSRSSQFSLFLLVCLIFVYLLIFQWFIFVFERGIVTLNKSFVLSFELVPDIGS